MAAPIGGGLGGQTLNDRILAAKHSLAGQGLAKAVCKATTEELIGPKKKHLDYLLHCTEEPNVSIPTLANLLIERAQSPNWIVVFKSLVTIHHLMCYGNERFVQYLASSNTSFQLSNFLDKGGVQGYDMSPFVRRYAKYLTEKSVSYRTTAFDFCKVKRGKDGGTLRQMNAEKLLKTLPQLQNQLDALVDFECTTQDLTNGVINSAFMLLFRDLIRLFACYNDGIINLLEKYFDMNKKNAKEALDSYKKFLIRMDRVAEFLKVAEKFGIDKSDIPDLAKAPSSLLEALESHLANLEGRKVGSPSATTPTGGATAAALTSNTQNEKITQQLIREEEEAMAKYKEQQKASNPFANPFSSAPDSNGTTAPVSSNATPNILDLFGMPEPTPAASAAPPKQNENPSGSADLLQLSGANPFASVLNTGVSSTTTQNAFDSSGGTAGTNFFGDILQPQGASQAGADLFGGGFGGFPATNGANNTALAGQGTNKPGLVTGDLDASLANLTTNLNLAGGHANNRNPGFTQAKGPPMGASQFGNQTLFGSTLQPQPVMYNMGNQAK